MASWQPPDDYRNRPVTVLGGGVLGRRIGEIGECLQSRKHVNTAQRHVGSRLDTTSF